MLRGRRPNIEHLKVFGCVCVCYARTEAVGRRKLDDRSRILVHLGIEPGTKAYRLFDPESNKIVVSHDVLFEEDKQWNWETTEASGVDDSGSFEVELLLVKGDDRVITPLASEDNNDETGGVEDEDDEGNDDNETHNEQTSPQLRRSTRVSTAPSYLDDYILIAEVECERLLMVINNEPWDWNEAKELQFWVDACEDELYSIEKNNTWVLVDLPNGFKPITIRKYKARLVAKGYVQRHGIDFDEVFALVARIETV